VQADRVERLCVSVSLWLVSINTSHNYEMLYSGERTNLVTDVDV